MQLETIPDDDLADIAWVCEFWGGPEKPLNPATIYRWAKIGRIPGPIKIGLQASRFSKTQQRTARKAIMAPAAA